MTENVIPNEAGPIMNWVLEAVNMDADYPDAEFWDIPAGACAMMVQESYTFDEVVGLWQDMGGDDQSYTDDDIEYRAWNYNRTGITELF